ncbi:MAG: NAD(P)H-dependent oxidoreductase [Bacteroidales bacterium]|nr:NAD(P)H-dependent oxidoreductase [Bacteroidales bacterium]
MNLEKLLNQRYSVKKFDETKRLTDEQVKNILKLTNLSASSYGMQPFKMVIVKEKEVKQKLVASSYGQTNIADSSYLIVFAARTDIDENFVGNYIGHIAKQRNVSIESLSSFRKMLVNYINNKDEKALFTWASQQIYIALGTFLIACASENIDACPIGGFIPSEYDKILKLEKHNLKPVVVSVMGYRHKDDSYQFKAKVRKPLNEMILKL